VKVVRGDWVLPIDAPPLADGAVVLDGDSIVDVGPFPEMLARRGDQARERHGAGGVVDLGSAVLLPALVNAHTHLELSWMTAAPPPRGDFVRWVRAMIGRRTPPPEEISASVETALRAVAASGTGAVGDVGNTDDALPHLRRSPLEGRFFREVIGRDARGRASFEESVRWQEGNDRVEPRSASFPASIVPHAPYSVSPEVLALIAERARRRGDVLSVHLAESREEVELLQRGEGGLRALFDEIGAVPAGWRAPGLSPAQVLDRAGLLGPRTVAVHGVRLTREDARLLAARGTTLALCPRSNRWLGVGEAPFGMLLEEGCGSPWAPTRSPRTTTSTFSPSSPRCARSRPVRIRNRFCAPRRSAAPRRSVSTDPWDRSLPASGRA
jgi:cytosine/adenosine deaminase-related metal-dependent hydrolase